jgi:hypothetical protein
LEGMVDAATPSVEGVEVFGRGVDDNGNLFCPDSTCLESYDSQHLALAHCSQGLYCKYNYLRSKSYAVKQVTMAVQERESQLRLEFEELQSLDSFARAVHLAKLHIMENILTLRCPRSKCHRAFVDFYDCCALTCSNVNCGAAFCAYCLADCGTDAHNHVSQCGEMFCTQGEFQAHHRYTTPIKPTIYILKLLLNPADGQHLRLHPRLLNPAVLTVF